MAEAEAERQRTSLCLCLCLCLLLLLLLLLPLSSSSSPLLSPPPPAPPLSVPALDLCPCWIEEAGSTLRSSQAVPHPSTNRALCRLTSEVGRDPVCSTWYGRQRQMGPETYQPRLITKAFPTPRPVRQQSENKTHAVQTSIGGKGYLTVPPIICDFRNPLECPTQLSTIH